MSIRPRYHEFINELAMSFINAPLAERARAIDGALARIGRFFDADRVYVFDYDFGAGSASNTSEWCKEGVEPQLERLQHYPLDAIRDSWVALHLRGEPVLIPAIDGLPDGALRRMLEPQGIKSLLALPLTHGNECLGFVGLDHVRHHHAFDTEEVEMLRLFAQLLVNLELRCRTDAELRTLWLAVEQSPNGIVITDDDARIVYANPRYLEMSGYSAEEVLGRDPGMMSAGRTPRERYEEMWRHLRAGQSWKGQFVNRRKDGTEVPEFVTVSPVRRANGANSHYLGIHEDITDKQRVAAELDGYRNRLEELVAVRTAELERSKASCEAANHAKNVFLANMSHELRTPLNAVIGMSFLLRRDLEDPRQRDRAAKIADSARHLLNLIDDILDFAKIEARQFSIETAPLRIAALVDHVYSMTAERAQAKGLEFECIVDRELRDLVLLGDFVRMGQVLLNFVGNAIKFTAQGRIGLRARRVREARGGVVVRFEVADTGIGIAAEALPRIFEPFEQVEASTTRKFGGAGLGLPISRQLANLMGGEVGVDSRPGTGSTFWFELALAPGSAVAAGSTHTPTPALHTEARVLLVEDNEVNRELAVELLHRAGLAVDVARDGEEAVGMVGAGDYDLVLMDLQMPRLGGLEATRRIRAQPRSRHLAIVALTANAGPEDRLACADAGVDDFIAKPAEPATLYAVLARWIPARPVTAPAADGAVLDADAGLRHVGGKPALYRRLLERFAETHLDDASRLRLALSKGDIDSARLIVHALKAAAATIGAEPVHAAAALVERTLAVEGLATDDGVRELSARLAVLGGVIATVARPGEAAATVGPGQAASTQLPESLRLLMSLLADDDFRACEVWRSVAEPLREVLAPTVADELDLLFQRFDFPAALARLRTLPAVAGV